MRGPGIAALRSIYVSCSIRNHSVHQDLRRRVYRPRCRAQQWRDACAPAPHASLTSLPAGSAAANATNAAWCGSSRRRVTGRGVASQVAPTLTPLYYTSPASRHSTARASAARLGGRAAARSIVAARAPHLPHLPHLPPASSASKSLVGSLSCGAKIPGLTCSRLPRTVACSMAA